MTLVGLGWAATGASDLHLLPGLVSPELKRLLRAEDQVGDKILIKELHELSGLTVTFAGQLDGTPASHGIALTTDKGEIGVDSNALRGRSFIVTATARQGTATATTRIRVYVHSAIDRLWLTPGSLTVRKGAKGMRFSVLARFDDGMIGDIGNWPPFERPGDLAIERTYVRAKGTNTGALAWTAKLLQGSGTLPVTVDPITGVLDAVAESGFSSIRVAFGAKEATALAFGAKPWNTPVTLTLLSGPGPREANFVPNVLFLPDGFTEADKLDYERMVRVVVDRLTTRPRTRPFAALAGRMNYFMGWVPSPDPGISVLNELYLEDPATDKGVRVPLPSANPPANWGLRDLVNVVGLPNPGDTALTDALVTSLRGIYGTTVTKQRLQPLFPAWRDLNDRFLFNERDTAFHMAFGSRPALDVDMEEHSIGTNPRRLADDDLNAFLDALRGPGRGGQPGRSLSGLWTTGKDNQLVVIVCRSNRNGGVNAGRRVKVPGRLVVAGTLGVSLGDDPSHRRRPGTIDGFDLVPDPVPADVYYVVWLTIAHELAHSFTLGDEYGGNPAPPSASTILETASEANLQDRDSLRTAGAFDAAKIKWGSWQRIAKAGVVGITPTASGGKLTVMLRDAKASRLRPGDIVRLRARPLPSAGEPSPQCTIESITGDKVVIEPLAGDVIDPDKFPAGSILMAPVRKPGIVVEELFLADMQGLQRIVNTGNPLNAHPLQGEVPGPPFDAVGRNCRNVELPVPTGATNFPNRKAPDPPILSSWTVGLYENGSQHNCGIYRPTGICLMSHQHQLDEKTKTLNLYEFCIVCRYAIIDHLDPTLHGQVEIDFVRRYGRRGAP